MFIYKAVYVVENNINSTTCLYIISIIAINFIINNKLYNVLYVNTYNIIEICLYVKEHLPNKVSALFYFAAFSLSQFNIFTSLFLFCRLFSLLM
jgi:hypothetical protein